MNLTKPKAPLAGSPCRDALLFPPSTGSADLAGLSARVLHGLGGRVDHLGLLGLFDRLVFVGHALLEAFDAFGDVAHQDGGQTKV